MWEVNKLLLLLLVQNTEGNFICTTTNNNWNCLSCAALWTVAVVFVLLNRDAVITWNGWSLNGDRPKTS